MSRWIFFFFFFSSRRRHTRCSRDWSSDVCSSDLDAALTTDQSRKLVMTVGPDGTVVPKVVEIGALSDGLRIVRSGLAADDQVVINGLMRARPGAKVTPQPGSIAVAARG